MPTGLRSVVRAATVVVVGMLLAIPVVLGVATPAHACRCAVEGIAQQARTSDLVVSGTLREVRGSDAGGRQQQGRQRFGTLTLVIDVDRAFSGRVTDPTIEVTTSAQQSACGLGQLPTDERYFFFATSDGTTLRANSCGGTSPATAQRRLAISAAVGEGRAVGSEDPPGEPTVVERTVVGDESTVSLPVAAAPGGALVVVGLIGLVVLGGLSRFRSRS